jgi:serine/threonine-protein kinase HipA
MPDVEVHIDYPGGAAWVGTLRAHMRRNAELATFEYDAQWLGRGDAFALEPALALTRGPFAPGSGMRIFGSIGDSAPDTWGRRLMQRAERRRAQREARPVRALTETDYLLGVKDVTRLGALRFRMPGQAEFLAPLSGGVPGMVRLGDLMPATARIIRDEETDADMELVLAPGSSLGGARPKVSVIDQHDRLSIAKFPKDSDDYSMELWESVALTLAQNAGIGTARHELLLVNEKPVLMSMRFDRTPGCRVPFLSAMSMLGLKDGDRASYPEIADALAEHGAAARQDRSELYRRMAFNVLISNVDDHLRNHGFLWVSPSGWSLSPAYDLNPTPADVRRRILTTSIDPDDATCSLDLVQSSAGYFGLKLPDARAIIREVGESVRHWREAAARKGARKAEIARMESAFEHEDLRNALAL